MSGFDFLDAHSDPDTLCLGSRRQQTEWVAVASSQAPARHHAKHERGGRSKKQDEVDAAEGGWAERGVGSSRKSKLQQDSEQVKMQKECRDSSLTGLGQEVML